jgi:hypothetical protein
MKWRRSPVKGFVILAYHLMELGLPLAQTTIDHFVEKALQLCEHEPPHRRMKRLGEYSHRWADRLSGCVTPMPKDYWLTKTETPPPGENIRGGPRPFKEMSLGGPKNPVLIRDILVQPDPFEI